MTLVSALDYLQQRFAKLAKSLLLIAILLFVASCGGSPEPTPNSATMGESSNKSLFAPRPKVRQVSPPALIQELNPWLDRYVPQVHIRQPKAEQVFDTTTVNVVLRVQDLPIYKDETWEMGPHLELILDNQPYGSIYDIEQPIVLENLTPGTHTLRVWAERPWHESFKNEGAYDQVTFHVFAKTAENSPVERQPLLTYGSPMGSYGDDPVLLDFYLTDAPLHQIAQDNPTIADWQIRYTINGDSFTVKDWQPLYIEGLKPGQNWVQLTLVDDQGQPIPGVFNNTVRLIDFDPTLNDSLAKIVRGDLTLEEVGRIIDPTYEPPVPAEPEVPEPMEPEVEPQAPTMESTPGDTDMAAPEETDDAALSEPEAETLEIFDEPAATTEMEEATDDAINDAIEQPQPNDDLDTATQPETVDDRSFDEVTSFELDATDRSLDIPDPEQAPRSVEAANDELKPQTVETPPGIEPPIKLETEPEAEPDGDMVEAIAPETTVEPSAETLSEDDAEAATTSTRKYFQRLYDYRDRAMENRDRN